MVKAQPYYYGSYELHVNIHMQPRPIKGSPFTIYAEGVTDTTETDWWSPDTTISLPGSPGSAAPGDCYIYVCKYLGKQNISMKLV